MRYAPEHKAEIHRKIVTDAARRVRREGLAGAAVSAVMRDNGLTHGGFYKHFKSKDDLLIESLRAAFGEIGDRLADAAQKSPLASAWKTIVNTYLGPEHCDSCRMRMPVGGSRFGTGASRCRNENPDSCGSDAIQEPHGFFHAGPASGDKENAFLAIFSTMIGAIEIARLLPETAMRERVLANAREFLLRSF